MIKFVCILCGEKISAREELAGKRVRCPKCNNTSVVPAESPKIRFACPSCGKGICVLQIHAGKEGKCPNCQSPIVVPSLRADPETGYETVTVVCSMCNETITIPKGSRERFMECPSCGSNVETSLGGKPPESAASIGPDTDESEYDEESDEDGGLDRRLILIVSGAALAVIAGVVILITVILPSGSPPAQERQGVQQRQETADTAARPNPAPAETRPPEAFTLEPVQSETPPARPGSSAAIGTQAVRNSGLRLQLSPGQKLASRMIREDKVIQALTGLQQEISSTKTTELEFHVEAVDPNGVARLKVTYLAIKEKLTGQGGAAQMQYDSTTPDTPTEHPFAPMYSAMIGRGFLARVTPEGIIAGFEGVDRMYLDMADAMVQGEDEGIRRRISERTTEGVEGRVRSAIEMANQRYGSRQKRVEVVRDLLKKNPIIAEEQVAEMVGNFVAPLPGRAVQAGDSWTAKSVLFSMGTVDIECTYTLKEMTPAVAVVSVGSDIDLDDELASARNSPLGSAKATLKGSYAGTLEIDPATGWMLRKSATMSCAGEVKMSPSKQMPQGMTLPVSMESVITIEPIG